MMVRMPFLFVAGAMPLDFLNTEVMLEGNRVDLIENSDDLLAWIAESGVARNPELRVLRAASPSTRESWLRTSLRLRADMRTLFGRLADGESLRDSDLRPLNDVLASTAGNLRVERGVGAVSLKFEARSVSPGFLLASATARFLSSTNLSLVRRCEGEGCILFFHDTTKSHTRRWCSMATCGNRTKVKAHYIRKRGGE
jgi:predicted RNA-binding Zn ribbon-like protein